MQAITDTRLSQTEQTSALQIPAEFVAYALLIALVLLMRFAYLGSVPMTEGEAIQALPAYHALFSDAAGMPQTAQSPVVFWLQWMSFTAFGGNEFAARLPGVIGGLLLTLTPLLFRRQFGAELTFLWCAALAFSPIAFTAARLSDPAIFSALFAMLTIWTLWHHWQARTPTTAIHVAVAIGALLLLAEAGGLLLGLVLLLSAALTLVWMISDAPDTLDSPGDDLLREVRAWLRAMPLLTMLAVGIGAVLAFATGALLYPAGLTIIGELLSSALRALIVPATDTRAFFAPVALFVYEWPLLLLGGVAALLLLFNRDRSVPQRFALSWIAVAFIALLLMRGTTPADGLWVVLPLSFVAASFVSACLDNFRPSLLSHAAYYSDDPNDYAWMKWLLAIIALAAGIMLALNFAELGRSALEYPGTELTFTLEQHNVVFFGRVGWFVIMLMVVIVGYVLAASIYGNRTAAQGFGLGAFLFALLMGAGIGWNTAAEQVTNPREWWYPAAVQADAMTLRETLFEIATRDTRRFPDIPITIVRDEDAGITGAGLVAWLVRDFRNAEFVDSLAAARQQQILLLPQQSEADEGAEPDLGGSYVGQSFALRQHWTPQDMILLDWPMWLAQRQTRPHTLADDASVLWLRIDVFSGEVPAILPRR